MKVITFHNLKGGVGKTSLSLNVGYELHRRNRKVLMIDLCVQANLTSGLSAYQADPDFAGNQRRTGIAESLLAMMDTVPMMRPLDYAVPIGGSGCFDLLAASPRLEKVDQQITLYGGNRITLLRQVLGLMDVRARGYDYVLVDTSPSKSWLIRNALVAADLIVVPVVPAAFSVDGVDTIHSTIDEIEAQNQGLRVADRFYVVNQHNRTFRDQRDYYYALADQFSPLARRPVRQDSAFPQSQTEGKAVRDFRPASKAAEDTEALAIEIDTLMQEKAA